MLFRVLLHVVHIREDLLEQQVPEEYPLIWSYPTGMKGYVPITCLSLTAEGRLGESHKHSR